MRVVCVGDSITFGQYLPQGVPAWPERIGAVGRGVCGETTRQALERFPRDVQENPADVTVLQWGHNDANRWRSDNGLPRVSLDAYRANLIEMIERCRAFDTVPVLCTITPTCVEDSAKRPRTERYDAALGEVAYQTSTAVADVRAAFLLYDGSIRDLLLPDGLHLSAAGHALYAETVASVEVLRPTLAGVAA